MADVDTSPTTRPPLSSAHPILTWAPTLLGALLVVVAGLHRAQFMLFGGRSYADSPLGLIELPLALVILVALCSWSVGLVVFALGKRWQNVGVAALNMALALVLLVLGVTIDPLTLIGGT